MQTEQLHTDRLTLRPVQLSDAERIQVLSNEWDIAKMTTSIPHPNPLAAVIEFVESCIEDHQKGINYVFAICPQQADELIGLIEIGMPQYDASALGYWLGKPYWGQGYMTEAVRRVIQFGFEALALNRVYASFFGHNPSSRRVMEKAGMTYEGTLRQMFLQENEAMNLRQYVDMGYCGILRAEWQAP